jgi:hypothetical protein
MLAALELRSAGELLTLLLAHPEYRTVLARAIAEAAEQRAVSSRPANASEGLGAGGGRLSAAT